MSEKAEVLGELRALKNEQEKALSETLTPDGIEDYVEREKRMEALLRQLGREERAPER